MKAAFLFLPSLVSVSAVADETISRAELFAKVNFDRPVLEGIEAKEKYDSLPGAGLRVAGTPDMISLTNLRVKFAEDIACVTTRAAWGSSTKCYELKKQKLADYAGVGVWPFPGNKVRAPTESEFQGRKNPKST